MQRRAELEDLKLQVESEIRKVYLDLQSATSQVEVGQMNVQVAKETLDLTRQRVEAGVANSVELVQSQESLASKGPYIVTAVRTLGDILRRMQPHHKKKNSMLRKLHLAVAFHAGT